MLVREYENCLIQMGYPYSASGATEKLEAAMKDTPKTDYGWSSQEIPVNEAEQQQ